MNFLFKKGPQYGVLLCCFTCYSEFLGEEPVYQHSLPLFFLFGPVRWRT